MSDGHESAWFLERLSLDASADQRMIRRAYAREVKRIDQGADPAGFQQLRTAYETALQWEEYQRYNARMEVQDGATAATLPSSDAADATEPGASADPVEPFLIAAPATEDAACPPAPVSAPEITPETSFPTPASGAGDQADRHYGAPHLIIDPEQLSADVFEALLAGCSGLAQGRTLHEAPAWERHLRTCLHDDRMMNLAARDIFEARIVHMLAAGWRTGHETLLEAAADVFEWRSDRHRLRRFGPAGAIVDRAIDERSMFDNQERELRAVQRDVIARLREGETPEPQQLRTDMPHAEHLAALFPTWLSLITSAENFQQWRAAFAALPPPPPAYAPKSADWTSYRADGEPVADGRPPATAPSDKPPSFWRRTLQWRWNFLLLVICCLCWAGYRLGSEQPARARSAPKPAQTARPVYVDLDQAHIAEIKKRIDYRFTHKEKQGKYKSEFSVELDTQGRIIKVDVLTPSGLPEHDAAVIKAIRETPPFAPNTVPKFKLRYEWEIILKQPTSSAGQQQGRKPAVAAPESEPEPVPESTPKETQE